MRSRFITTLLTTVLLSCGASAPPAAAAEPLATCFWEGPVSMKRPTSRGFDGRGFNFPEESATYWLARFKLPAGTKLRLRGRYSRSRYQSINAYSAGEPTDALADVQTEPDAGSVNPFVAGNRRDSSRRGYTVTVLDQPRPSTLRAPNTLYARTGDGASIELFYRVYEPDRGLDLDGGTGLPEPELVGPGGSTVRGSAACAQVNDPNRSIPQQTIAAPLWRAGRNAPGCDGTTNPAYEPVRWERFFNIDYAQLAVIADCTNQGRAQRLSMPPEERGGFYSNRDNAYIYAHLSRRFGRVLTVRGKLPTVPRTFDRQKRMEAGQLRFWSLCTGESRVTVRTPDCVADRELPVDSARRFTVVVSRKEDRPANARESCGVSWIDWGARGDGAGDPDYAVLILRNMLPAAGFSQAVQRVTTPGSEPDVMGDHFPATSYGTKSGFEQRGCSSSVLTLGRRLVLVRGKRRVRVRVSCLSYEENCAGRLTMRRGRRLVGRVRFRVRSGRTSRVTFKLSRKGLRRYRRARRVAIRAVGATPAGVNVSDSVRYRLRRR